MAREQQILRAAEELIFARGFDGVGVDAIGELAGVSGSAIYRHFNGKNEILAVLFDQTIDTLLIRVGEPLADPAADLRHLIRVHVEFAAQRPKLAAIWLLEQRSLDEPHRRAYRRRQRSYNERWRQALGRRYPGQSPDRISSAMRAVHALMLSDATRPTGSRGAEDVTELLIAMTQAALEALAP